MRYTAKDYAGLQKRRVQQKSFADQPRTNGGDPFSKELMLSYNSELYMIFSMGSGTYGYDSCQVKIHVIRTD